MEKLVFERYISSKFALSLKIEEYLDRKRKKRISGEARKFLLLEIVGKKSESIQSFWTLNVCFVKFDLRVLKDIRQKIGRKLNDIGRKTLQNPLMLLVLRHSWGWRKYSKFVDIYCGKKVHKNTGISQTQFATLFQNDVKNVRKWWILMRHENAKFCFKEVQNAWIHSQNRFTF